MKKGILLVILLFLYIYSCEKKEDLNSEKGEIKLTCDISYASKKESAEEWEYYWIDSEGYPLFYFIWEGELMDRKELKEWILNNCGEPEKEEFGWCEWIEFLKGDKWYSKSIEGFPPWMLVFYALTHVIYFIDDREPVAETKRKDLRIYVAGEELKKSLNYFLSFPPENCEQILLTLIGEHIWNKYGICSSESGCLLDIHPFYFRGIENENCQAGGYFPQSKESLEEIYPYIYTGPYKGHRKCYRNIFYNGQFYPDGLSLPEETSFGEIKGKFKVVSGIGGGASSKDPDVSVRGTSYGFLWEAALDENIILGIISYGMEGGDKEGCCYLSYSPNKSHPLYGMAIYLKVKGDMGDGLNGVCNELSCEKGERIDKCIYRGLKMEDVFSCLEKGKERINEDGSLFPFFTTSSWCDENVECPYDEFKRTFFSPPFSCPPGYPFSEE